MKSPWKRIHAVQTFAVTDGYGVPQTYRYTTRRTVLVELATLRFYPAFTAETRYDW